MELSIQQGGAIGIAWDNYDRFVATRSGKDTLHDTVGITYQVVTTDSNEGSSIFNDKASNITNQQSMTTDTSVTKADYAPISTTERKSITKKRRRAYEPIGLEIQPYRKKPKMTSSEFLSPDDPKRAKSQLIVAKEAKTRTKDILWMIDVYTHPTKNIPMWSGWNSLLLPRDNNIQKIWYLPQINESPTSNAVVVETLQRSLRLASECGKSEIAVTYDLAIAKVAMQKPKFDKIFVAMGSFHIEMALLCAFGKVLDESGGPHVLNECEVLATGSLKSFISGKNYKRCKRMHELLALSMETLHFEAFLAAQEDSVVICEMLKIDLDNIRKNTITEGYTYSKELEEIMTKYLRYTERTRAGELGKTANYWIQYVSMIHTYHDFSRSIRTGDLDLYISCLQKVTNYFFALNHPNYARWTVRYHDNLLKLQETHPEIYDEFKAGWFGIKRTSKPFSKCPIDLTLEQTINKDAASQSGGISAMTNSISARQRWAQSHFLRTSVISNIFDEYGLVKKEDISNDLKPHRIKSDNLAVNKIISMLKETMNPFSNELDKENLYNIGTGKAASERTERFLLNIEEIGKREQEKFIKECFDDPSRFEKPIKKQKLNTFAAEIGRRKLSGSNGKLIAACLVRDIFGSILYLSVQKKIDIAKVLKYPLTPVPLSLSHVDGTMQKTPKSALMAHLEARIKSTPPTSIDVTVIDAMFFLHLHTNLPISFGGVSTYLLKRILDCTSNIIHFVSDKYITPSVKDCERIERASDSTSYQITGASQKRPSNWLVALRNSKFKESLIEFLMKSWDDDLLAEMLQQKVLYANSGNICYKFEVIGGKMVKSEVNYLYSTHEEADSRMFFHLTNVSSPANAVVRTADTDCLIIALGCKRFYNPLLKIWLEVGLMSKNTLRYINVNELHTALGEPLCNSVLAYHSFTGCDYSASFSRKGKIKPFKILEKMPDVQEAFSQLAATEGVSDDTITKIEKFVSLMYGKKNVTSVNDARTNIFFDKYKPKKEGDPISCVKSLDGSAMPPCARVLLQKLKRTNYISNQWLASIVSDPPHMSPLDYGWKLEEEGYKIQWYEGNASPSSLDIVCREDDSDEVELGGMKLLQLILMHLDDDFFLLIINQIM